MRLSEPSSVSVSDPAARRACHSAQAARAGLVTQSQKCAATVLRAVPVSSAHPSAPGARRTCRSPAPSAQCVWRARLERLADAQEVELCERGEFMPEPLAFLVDEWRVSCAAIETDPQGVQVWSHELLEHPLPARRVLNGVRKNPGEATNPQGESLPAMAGFPGDPNAGKGRTTVQAPVQKLFWKAIVFARETQDESTSASGGLITRSGWPSCGHLLQATPTAATRQRSSKTAGLSRICVPHPRKIPPGGSGQ